MTAPATGPGRYAVDAETREAIDALVTRAAALDLDFNGKGGASTVTWWRCLVTVHHIDIAPLPFAELAALNNRQLYPRIIAIRRAASGHQNQPA